LPPGHENLLPERERAKDREHRPSQKVRHDVLRGEAERQTADAADAEDAARGHAEQRHRAGDRAEGDDRTRVKLKGVR
jgi:hypothetical protein